MTVRAQIDTATSGWSDDEITALFNDAINGLAWMREHLAEQDEEMPVDWQAAVTRISCLIAGSVLFASLGPDAFTAKEDPDNG